MRNRNCRGSIYFFSFSGQGGRENRVKMLDCLLRDRIVRVYIYPNQSDIRFLAKINSIFQDKRLPTCFFLWIYQGNTSRTSYFRIHWQRQKSYVLLLLLLPESYCPKNIHRICDQTKQKCFKSIKFPHKILII